MPCSAVNVWCAASASSSASTSRFNRSAASSRAMFFSVLILAAERPSRPRRWARALRIGSGSNGSKAAVRRPQIAEALAVESCWPGRIAARPANPGSRCRSAGMPVSSKIGFSRMSCLTRAWMASSRSDWLLRWMVIRECYRLAGSSCAGLPPPLKLRRAARDCRGEAFGVAGTRAPILYRKRLLHDGLPDQAATTVVWRIMPPVFRFAPSPNGYLHLGHAYSALLNFDLARRAGGRFLLRIEDIDATRCRPEFEAAIYEDLAWLGICWETPVRRQSQHFSSYRVAVEGLAGLGLIYPSFESRAEIARLVAQREAGAPWPRDPDGAPLYPGAAKSLSPDQRRQLIAQGTPYALRLDMAVARARTGDLSWKECGEGPGGESGVVTAQPEAWGDVILARKETPTSYHLSVVIDDALQGVTDVVRGRDLFHATSVHRLLQKLLDLPAPVYRHHRLVLDEAGQKLSKSTRATGLRELRAAGLNSAGIRRVVGFS